MEAEKEPETQAIFTVGVLILNRDKVLLVKRGKTASHVPEVYGLPAGRVRRNENEQSAAIRELREETGLTTRSQFLKPYPKNIYVSNIERKDGTTQLFSIQIFICKAYTGSLQSSEETIPEWVEIESLSKLKLLPNVKKAVYDGWRFLST